MDLPAGLAEIAELNVSTPEGKSIVHALSRWKKHLPGTVDLFSWYLSRDRQRASKATTQIQTAYQQLLREQKITQGILTDIGGVPRGLATGERARAVAMQARLARTLPPAVDQMTRTLKGVKQRLQTAFNHAQSGACEVAGLPIMEHGQHCSWEDANLQLGLQKLLPGGALNREQLERLADYVQEVCAYACVCGWAGGGVRLVFTRPQ